MKQKIKRWAINKWKDSIWQQKAIFLLCLFLTLWLVGGITYNYVGKKLGFVSTTKIVNLGGNKTAHNEFAAYNFAEGYIKKHLKSPSTATFPGRSERSKHTTYLGGGVYRITSYVDSQNSFGAMIRTKFSCDMAFKNGKVSFKLNSID